MTAEPQTSGRVAVARGSCRGGGRPSGEEVEEGRGAIPKSTRPDRIAENFDVFDFELSSEQMTAIDALDSGVRGGPEPDSITLESYGMPIPEA